MSHSENNFYSILDSVKLNQILKIMIFVFLILNITIVFVLIYIKSSLFFYIFQSKVFYVVFCRTVFCLYQYFFTWKEITKYPLTYTRLDIIQKFSIHYSVSNDKLSLNTLFIILKITLIILMCQQFFMSHFPSSVIKLTRQLNLWTYSMLASPIHTSDSFLYFHFQISIYVYL